MKTPFTLVNTNPVRLVFFFVHTNLYQEDRSENWLAHHTILYYTPTKIDLIVTVKCPNVLLKKSLSFNTYITIIVVYLYLIKIKRMKYVFKFILQTLAVILIFTPIVVCRFIWNFKWNDKFDGTNRIGIYSIYKRSYHNLVRRIKGQPVQMTF